MGATKKVGEVHRGESNRALNLSPGETQMGDTWKHHGTSLRMGKMEEEPVGKSWVEAAENVTWPSTFPQ